MTAPLEAVPMTPPLVRDTSAGVRVHSQAGYLTSIGYLRAWITVLVLGHHAVLAYHPYAPPLAKSMIDAPRMWAAFPVIDKARFAGWALFVGSNENFFMALMFMLSGLFVWPTLQRKGAAGYLRDRALRLGVPFVVLAGVLAPLAYHPAYLQMGGTGWSGYLRDLTAPGMWSSGPAWFLWVLLVFDFLIAGVHRLAPGAVDALGRWAAGGGRTARAFAGLFVVSSLGYVALELAAGPAAWWSWGPFAVQTSRILHYLVYFLFGVGLGACGIERTVFAPGAALAKRWGLWLALAAVAFFVSIAAFLYAISLKPLPMLVHVGGDLAYTLSSAASTFAALALFLRFARTRNEVFAALAPCAYGMYLVHYPIASHLQFALLDTPFGGLAKGILVWAGTFALSWGIVAMLRRVEVIARVI